MDTLIFFGYKIKNLKDPERPIPMDEMMKIMDDPPLCMIQLATKNNIKEIQKGCGVKCYKGQWLISSGDCQTEIEVKGPYNKLSQAFDTAVKYWGVNKFFSPPVPDIPEPTGRGLDDCYVCRKHCDDFEGGACIVKDKDGNAFFVCKDCIGSLKLKNGPKN